MPSEKKPAVGTGSDQDRPATEPKPDPTVEAPEFVWISKGYDPKKPNPGRVGEPERSPEGNE